MQEGIEGFPFENRADAQMFSDLLVSRTRSLLTCAPNLEDREEDIVNFIDMCEAEMVSKACPGCFSGPDAAFGQLAGARFAGKCYLSNFRIQYPAFYEQVSSIMRLNISPSLYLKALLDINILDVKGDDPTRAGPPRYPWFIFPGTPEWNVPLAEAIGAFKAYVSSLALPFTGS
jgi:hypothetical protein